MRLAHEFQRLDPDALKDEVSHEQYQEWLAYFQNEPRGWQALSIVAQHLAYHAAQTHSRKRLRPRDYAIRLRTGGDTVQQQKAQLEAGSIRSKVAAAIRQRKLAKRAAKAATSEKPVRTCNNAR